MHPSSDPPDIARHLANEEAGRGSIITFRIPRTASPAAPGADDGDDAPSFVRRRDPS